MIRLIISTDPTDMRNMEILLAGLEAHSEADAFPMWTQEGFALLEQVTKALPQLCNLHDTWGVTLLDPEAMLTLALLMESVAWHVEGAIAVVDEELKVMTLAEFHKHAVAAAGKE